VSLFYNQLQKTFWKLLVTDETGKKGKEVTPGLEAQEPPSGQVIATM
jgi:hypothetical protein